MHSLRDAGEWVHVDALYQAYLHACLIMLAQGTPIDPGLPLYDSKVQAGFAQCGGPHILSLVTEVATRALKAVWYQKWFVQHRLRPEEYGGHVHNHMTHGSELRSPPGCREFEGRPGNVLEVRDLSVADGIPGRLSHSPVIWLGPCNGSRCVRHCAQGIL